MEKKYMKVRQERTGWRDTELENLLKEHQITQPDSFLVTEYNYGKSVAIIEYNDISHKAIPDNRLINYCALRKNKECYFIILFDYEQKENKPIYRIDKFIVHSGNRYAAEFLNKNYKKNNKIELTELQFIKFLYKIRDNEDSKYYEQAIKNHKDWFDLELRCSSTYDISKNIISNRHRNYAFDVPAADIDCFMCDEKNVPYLFIEYKANFNFNRSPDNGHNHFISANISFETNSLNTSAKTKLMNKAIMDLGDGCIRPIPVIAVEYNLENKIFSLYAFNKYASDIVTLGTMSMEEYFTYIKDPSNFRKKELLKKKEKVRICPNCGNTLELKEGKFGKFYGCTGFKINGCRYTEKYIKKT